MSARRKMRGFVPPLLPLALLNILLTGCASAETFKTVNSIRDAMYEEQKYFGGCYKLLNATGPTGCAAPRKEPVDALLINLRDLPERLSEPRAVIVPAKDAQSFIVCLAGDSRLQENVKAVLVLGTGAAPASQSSASTFPGGAEYAPYATPQGASQYVWNPFGSDTAHRYLEIPIFRLEGKLAEDVEWRGTYNAQQNFGGASHFVQAQLTMEAVQPNSTACLLAGTCQPMGGFSVWSAMPPLPTDVNTGLPARTGKPVTLVAAQIDTGAFFHDSAQAANSPLSGLLAMLVAMQILKEGNMAATYTRQLVFTAFAGEPWGYIGSKRLLWESARGNSTWTAGLDLEDIDQVVEVGQIGLALQKGSNTTQLYLHTQKQGGPWGDTSQVVAALQDAALSSSVDLPLTVTPASSSNPGVPPPSSLFSFLRAKPSIAGVVITEFDKQYINSYFHSEYDNASFVSAEPIMAAAAMLARALHQLAAPEGSPALAVNVTRVRQNVQALAACLAVDSPGMSCATATALLNPDFQVTDQRVSYAVKHYLGVLAYIHPDPDEPYFKKTVYRFLWNYMGLLSAASEAESSDSGVGQECAFQANRCPAGLACIGWKGSNNRNKQLMGRCMRTTVRYVPALPTKLDFWANDQGAARFFFTNASDAWSAASAWPAEPLWAESNWPSTTPFVRVLLRESVAVRRWIGLSGVIITAATLFAAYLGKAMFEKKLRPGL